MYKLPNVNPSAVRVAARFQAAISKEDVDEATKAKKTIHEWTEELSTFANDMEKFAGKIDKWREKLPEPEVQAKHYERVDDDLSEAQAALTKAVSKLRKLAHDLGG